MCCFCLIRHFTSIKCIPGKFASCICFAVIPLEHMNCKHVMWISCNLKKVGETNNMLSIILRFMKEKWWALFCVQDWNVCVNSVGTAIFWEWFLFCKDWSRVFGDELQLSNVKCFTLFYLVWSFKVGFD